MKKVTDFLKQHWMIALLFIGGAAFVLIRMRSGSSSSSGNTATTCTDAAGNPVDCTTGQALAGASVSPTLSPTDLQTQFQDLQQQILNWEQSFQPNNPPSNSPGSTSQPPVGVPPIRMPTDPTLPLPVDQPVNIPGGFPGNPPTNYKAHLLSLLGINVDPTVPGAGISSWYQVPQAETTVQLASAFGLQHGWTDIAYNPHDQFLLGQAFAQHGNNQIKAGTFVWIPTTQIPG